MKKSSDFLLSAKTKRAAARLSSTINLESMLQHASLLKSSLYLEVVRSLIMRLGLELGCDRSDILECLNFLDSLICSLAIPCTIQQVNVGCQQFFEPITNTILR